MNPISGYVFVHGEIDGDRIFSVTGYLNLHNFRKSETNSLPDW